MDKLYYIIGAISFAWTWLSPSVRSTLWGWLIKGLKKALTDETVTEQQKQITNDLKMAIEMIQAVNTDQRSMQGELKNLAGQNLDILNRIKTIDDKEERQNELIGNLREKIAKLEGKVFK